jgi:hypothetical protein
LLSGQLHGSVDTVHDFVVDLGGGQFLPVRELPGRKRVFVPTMTLQCMALSLRYAKSCGAPMDPDALGPQWESLGVSPEELIAAGSRDFAARPHTGDDEQVADV